MKNLLLKRVAVLASASALVLLSACGGSGSGDSGSSSVAASNVIASSDFTFPDVTEVDDQFAISSPEGATPSFPARRTLQAGSGNTIEFSDPVVLRYDMFSWSTGELVESTNDFDEPLTIRAGVTEGVPEFLSHSLLGRRIGDRIQIIFEEGMEDLPPYLDANDAYVLVIEII